MKYERSAGILLHPTSLPGPDGIGDFGPEAFRWIDFLSKAGFSLWQILPLGPTGYADSPYQSFSAFAGNPNLISPVLLVEDGLVNMGDLSKRPELPPHKVDYAAAHQWKNLILDLAFENYQKKSPKKMKAEFEQFCHEQEFWLDDFSLFLSIKENSGNAAWNVWEPALRSRKPLALQEYKDSHQTSIQKHTFNQFLFFRQWQKVHQYAGQKGIKIIGDIPIFVAFDSADAWANPDLFYLDKNGSPSFVAGVPPDYFSPTGQLWGNPLYRWNVHQKTGYAWWLKRLSSTLKLVDIARLDHFRGFAGYWEIPAGMPTAEIGRWKLGPGKDFFITMKNELGDLPIIAEDLGEITPDVVELRDEFGLPGMKIFQFAFDDDPSHPFLPHNYPTHCVAYTGTHDNDTTLGWYQTAPEKECDFTRRYLARSGEDISWDMIRAVWVSNAVFSIAPLQDFLSLGSEARMNTPGVVSGNWQWRMPVKCMDDEWLILRMRDTNFLYGRIHGTYKKK